jgi:activating signal cointegrator complex subunit 3
MPIESNFEAALPDHLNAEIVSGTVTNVREAVMWLSYTYLYIRMLRNPMVYGIPYEERAEDPELFEKRYQMVCKAALRLDECEMIRFDETSGSFGITDLGRVASHFYIAHGTIMNFNYRMSQHLDYPDLVALICSAHEFANIRVRDEELQELDRLKQRCHLPVRVFCFFSPTV